MIELRVMRRMLRRGMLLAPAAIVVVWILQGQAAAAGTGVGIALALGNLYIAGRIIGGIAENAPHLMLPGALAAFMLGMISLVLVAVVLRGVDGWSLPAAGISLIVAHLVLVMWEAAQDLLAIPKEDQSETMSGSLRS